MPQDRVFDRPHYRALDQARIALLRQCLADWKGQLGLQTAWDMGCGVGNFSTLLLELGFDTKAVDGREDNATEARRRNPGLDVRVADVEDATVAELGTSDLVLCFGLLYHLENPFHAIRNLYRLAGKLMIVESVCTGDEHPTLLLCEEESSEDQGLRHIAFYPSEACLIKMLYCSGFSNVYRFVRLPDHEDFTVPLGAKKTRTILAATRAEFDSSHIEPVVEPLARYAPWAANRDDSKRKLRRISRLFAK